jgi:hypothetical protein
MFKLKRLAPSTNRVLIKKSGFPFSSFVLPSLRTIKRAFSNWLNIFLMPLLKAFLLRGIAIQDKTTKFAGENTV